MQKLISLEHIADFCEGARAFFFIDKHIVARHDVAEFLNKIPPHDYLLLDVLESQKNLSTAMALWNFLFEARATRSDVVVNVGGGVVCDVGGFVASTYMRGMRYINVPTTLLCMVDAATGGKTGVNFHGIKNGVGLICEPSHTLLYTAFLSTLPDKEFLSGYAEVVKHALLDSETEWQRVRHIFAGTTLEELVLHSASIKARFANEDIEERGIRKALNLGHTIGHAIEELALERGTPLPHGYAVMYGLVGATYLSVRLCGFSETIYREVRQLWKEKYRVLELSASCVVPLISLMRHDKKNLNDKEIIFTLLSSCGEVVVNRAVSERDISEAISYLI